MTTNSAHTKPSRRRIALLGGLGLSAALLTGCANAGEGAISGAGLGALAGLIVGSMSGNAGDGAAIGAAIGGVGGAVIGDQNEREASRARTVPRHDHYERPRYSDDW